MNKQLLAEFTGVDDSCPMFSYPDFTTHVGYGLLHDEMGRRGAWGEFNAFIISKDGGMGEYAIRRFHEDLSCAQKSALISDALEAGVLEVE